MFLLDTQKEPKRYPLLPIAREARLKGAGFVLRTNASAKPPHIAPLRIQERTDWPLPGANTLRWDVLQFLFFIADFRSFVGAASPTPRGTERNYNTFGWYFIYIRSVGKGLDPSLQFCGYANSKPPLCKGRWHGAAVTEGLWPYGGRPIYGQGHNPPVCAIAQPAPFTQGGL